MPAKTVLKSRHTVFYSFLLSCFHSFRPSFQSQGLCFREAPTLGLHRFRSRFLNTGCEPYVDTRCDQSHCEATIRLLMFVLHPDYSIGFICTLRNIESLLRRFSSSLSVCFSLPGKIKIKSSSFLPCKKAS
jgi:hypothetical protein